MQKMYKISFLIVLKMSILEENVSKLWAELQQMQKYSKTTLEWRLLWINISVFEVIGTCPPFSIKYLK